MERLDLEAICPQQREPLLTGGSFLKAARYPICSNPWSPPATSLQIENSGPTGSLSEFSNGIKVLMGRLLSFRIVNSSEFKIKLELFKFQQNKRISIDKH